jgi:ornithine cyclodeaminase/alanine dehydrogenase-like protein (mu-crystallin family)
MAFGLNNAMGTFTRTMIEVFKNRNNKFLKIFVDDVNMHNKIYKDHLSHLRNVLSKL